MFLDIYLLYAKLEEEYGLARHSMAIYNRACKAVEKEDMHLVSDLFVFINFQFCLDLQYLHQKSN